MADEAYNQWREEQVKTVGLDIQLEAENNLDKIDAQPEITVIDHEDKMIRRCKKGVAERYIKRGRFTLPKAYCWSPNSEQYKANYEKIDWSRN